MIHAFYISPHFTPYFITVLSPSLSLMYFVFVWSDNRRQDMLDNRRALLGIGMLFIKGYHLSGGSK